MPKNKKLKPSRRQVLAGGAAAGLLGLTACDKKPTDELSERSILEAEKLFDVNYTDAERAQMLPTIEDDLDRLRALRALKQPNTLAPAHVFDPRLPGKIYPIQSNLVSASGNGNGFRPASDTDIAFAPLTDLSVWMQSGQITSLELTDIYLKRIEKYGPGLKCFVTVTRDLARAEAREADTEFAAGNSRGPLHGIPYALKDLMDTKDIKTTWGATPFKDRVATDDAAIVTKLREAGAVLLGKTTCGAIAYGDIWFGGKTRNPWNIQEGSSGSSAGSASATAAGLCGFSIGTETLGSIVSPSNRCGTAGLRPTFGRVPRTGAMALCWSLDKIGPICRAAEDTIFVLEALNGYDVTDPASIRFGLEYNSRDDFFPETVGYDPRWYEGDVNPVDQAAFDALKGMGVALKEIHLPDRPYSSLIDILLAEAAAAFEELTEDDRDDDMVWQDPDAWPNSWRKARFYSAVDMINADRLRRTIMQDMDKIFDEVDLIAGPNFAGSMLTITNYTGHPQLSFRAGFMDSPTRQRFGDDSESTDSHRVPRNFSLWGPLFCDGRLVRFGVELERALGAWAERPNFI